MSYLLIVACGGLLLATHISHETISPRQPPTSVVMPNGWITTPTPSHVGYFRQTLEVPFRPYHAWISIAAEDYRLYVNEVEVAQNIYLLRGGTAYQDRLSAREQRLTRGEVFPRGSGATLAKPAKQEWRMVHFHDVSSHLRQGRNTVAVYVQSGRRSRLAVSGLIEGFGAAAMDISGHASDWRASTEARAGSDLTWFHEYADDLGWDLARPDQPPRDLPLFAAAEPAIWREPFIAQAITSPQPGEEKLFRRPIAVHEGERRGWLRVWSNWRYDLFVGTEWLGAGGGSGQVEAYDVSASLAQAPEQISIRLHRGVDPDDASAAEAPWLAVDGRIGTLPISTPHDWAFLDGVHADWLAGGGTWIPAPVSDLTSTPGTITLQPAQGRTWWWFGRWITMSLTLGLALAALVWGLSMRESIAAPGAPDLARGCWLLAPAILGILLVEGLRFRFSESDALLGFLDPDSAWLRLSTGPVLLLVGLGWLRRPLPSRPVRLLPVLRARIASIPPFLWLIPICMVGLALRMYALDFQPPSSDEYTSWAAAQGILRTGVPEAASGILYTRSPLYHYSLAGWLGLFGDTVAAARGFSLVPGLGVIVAAYLLVAAITRRALPALLTALVLALDPWLLGMTNLIRFYPLMQFFAVLSVLAFVKGFVRREGRRYQNLFFVCATAAVLSQEIFALTLAAFLLAFLLWYRPFDWRQDRNVWLGFAWMMLIIALDMRTYSTVSMTPHVALSSQSESLFVPHLVDVFGEGTAVITQLATDFFWLNNGENAFWTALFLAGLPLWVWRGDRTVLTLYVIVLGTLPVLTLLLVQVQTRYTYSLYPIFVAAAVISADALLRRIAQGRFGASALPWSAAPRRCAQLIGALLIVGWAASAEFGKFEEGYAEYRDLDYPRAWEYVASHRRPEDRTLAVRPAGAAVVLGGIDYYAMVGSGFDALYQNGRGVVDRRAGGKLVWKVDQLREVLLRHPRVWVIVDQPRWAGMNPGVEGFLRECCDVEAEFFGGQVLLWDRSAGRFSTAADQGGGGDSF